MTPEEAKAFSRAARDFNLSYLDETVAASSRCKRLIISGTQDGRASDGVAGNAFFQKRADVVGLDFSLRFHKPVFADETITLEWSVD